VPDYQNVNGYETLDADQTTDSVCSIDEFKSRKLSHDSLKITVLEKE